MKSLSVAAMALVLTSSAASAWTTRSGHWVEGPTFFSGRVVLGSPYGPAYVPYGPPAGYYDVPPPPPVVVVPPAITFGIGPNGFFFSVQP